MGAVDWLMDKISYDNGYGVIRNSFDEMKDLSEFFEQAKVMEKEQIEEAYWASYKEGQYSGDKTAEQYYNETYKQQDNGNHGNKG